MLLPVLETAPATRIISTAEAKAHLRVDGSDEDDLIAGLVLSAEKYLDGYTGILGRALVTQTWSESRPWFDYRIPLRVMPVQSITSVQYYDADGNSQTVSSDVYRLHTGGNGPYLVQVDGKSWPGGTRSRDDAVTVTYVCGYGDASTDVPQPIIQAALMLVAHWFENRGVVGKVSQPLKYAVDALIAPYKSRAGWPK